MTTPMTWLQIARRIRREAGITGSDASPLTLVGQTGEMQTVIGWMTSAWTELETAKLWGWMWEEASPTILAGTHILAQDIPPRRYMLDTARTTRPLAYVPWEQFRSNYPSAQISDGDPSAWTIRPDKSIAVNRKPLADLPISLERYRNPQGIGNDNESPPLPADHHEAIVWRAVMLYAGHDEAVALYQHAKAEYDRHRTGLSLDELPNLEFGEPLA